MLIAALILSAQAYRPMQTVTYCTVDQTALTMNVFLPSEAARPTGALVEVHGGWFMAGGPMTDVPAIARTRNLAFFSITYRLGDKGGFPQCIRDCRNAIRFIRKNAALFNVDGSHIAVGGGSAGGHLSLMVAMAPDRFDDGGPTPGLEGVSAKVCGAFAWIPPADFVRFWEQGPSDEVVHPDGTRTFRGWNDKIPNDARPHLRALFHGVAPDTDAARKLYTMMCPIGQVRRGLPPVLICDGEKDPIVPGLEGKELYEHLKQVGDDATYWMTPGGGHDYPSGPGFDAVLGTFLDKIFGK